MSTATLERPSRTGQRLMAAVRAELRARSAPRPAVAGSHRTLFEVPFCSPMGDRDAQRLAAAAGIDCDLHPKLRGATVSPGLRRLDYRSGLFLVRGEQPGQWRLEGRTWGHPAAGAVRRWHLYAAAAARAIDPTVPATPANREEPR